MTENKIRDRSNEGTWLKGVIGSNLCALTEARKNYLESHQQSVLDFCIVEPTLVRKTITSIDHASR